MHSSQNIMKPMKKGHQERFHFVLHQNVRFNFELHFQNTFSYFHVLVFSLCFSLVGFQGREPHGAFSCCCALLLRGLQRPEVFLCPAFFLPIVSLAPVIWEMGNDSDDKILIVCIWTREYVFTTTKTRFPNHDKTRLRTTTRTKDLTTTGKHTIDCLRCQQSHS